MSHEGWVQPAIADLHGRAGGAGEQTSADTDVEHLGGPVEHDSLDISLAQDRDELAGRDHLSVGELADPAERLLADQHLQQHPGLGGVGGLGGGALGHESARHLPPLALGCGPGPAAGAVTDPRPGVGPVGLPERLFEAFQLAQDDGAAHRVEQRVHDHDVVIVPRSGQLRLRLERLLSRLLGEVGFVECFQ